MKPDQDQPSRRAAPSADSLAQRPLEHDERASGLGPAAVEGSEVRATSLLQNLAGNDLLGTALTGDHVGGFGSALAHELTGAVAGLQGGGPLSSNQAMMRVMRDTAFDAEAVSRDIEASSGRPLPSDQRERMERAFEHDFGHVRIHTDAAAERSARGLQAHAFALGAEIFFGRNTFRPGTSRGDRLLAHELTHVVQHDQGRLPRATEGTEVSSPSDPHEVEAYANEQRMLRRLLEVEAELEAEAEADQGAVEATGEAALAPKTPKGEGTLDSAATALGAGDFLSPEDLLAGVAEEASREAESGALEPHFGPDLHLALPEARDQETDAGSAFLEAAGEEDLLRLAGLDHDGLAGDLPALTPEGHRAPTPDEATRATRALLARLAPRLGLNASRIEVRLDDEAAARAQAAGSAGLVADGAVWIDPEHFDPATRSGQHILAHEVAHVAQATLPGDEIATPAHAEAEAEVFADSFVAGQATAPAQVPLPTGYTPLYDGPTGGDLGAMVDAYKDLSQQNAELAEATAEAQGQGDTPAAPDRPNEKSRNELKDFKKGLKATVKGIKKLDAFDDLIDACHEGEATGGPLSRIKRTDHYENAVDMYKGAETHEKHRSAMLSRWEKSWDKGWGRKKAAKKRAYRTVKEAAEADALAQLRAEEALAELEAAKSHEQEAPTEVPDGGESESGQGQKGGSQEGALPDGAGSLPEPVSQLPPPAPAYMRAEERLDIQAFAAGEVAHYESYQGHLEAGESRGWGRTAQVATEFGKGFAGGFAGSLADGLRDKFTTDLVGGGIDRMLEASPRFGKHLEGAPFASNVIKGYQSGLLGDVFTGRAFTGESKVWEGWQDKHGKAVESMGGMFAVVDAWSDAEGWDYVGLVFKFAADLFQMLAELFGLINDVLTTIETLCFILGGLFVILGICLGWLGLAFLLPIGLKVLKVAKAMKKITTPLGKVVTALSATAALLRPIAALTVPAELYGQELAATGAAGETFGDAAGSQVADDLADKAKDWAKSEPKADADQKPNPAEAALDEGDQGGEGDAQAIGEAGEQRAEDLADLNRELQERSEQEQANQANQAADQEQANQANQAADAPEAKPEKGGTLKAVEFVGSSMAKGITSQFTDVKDVRNDLRIAGSQLEELIHDTRFGEKVGARDWQQQNQDLESEIKEKRDAALETVLVADAAGQEMANKLTDAEDRLWDLKQKNATPEDIKTVEAEVKAIRESPELRDVVEQYDRIYKDVSTLEEQLHDLRNRQRDDVQGAMLDEIIDDEVSKSHWRTTDRTPDQIQADREATESEIGVAEKNIANHEAAAEQKEREAAELRRTEEAQGNAAAPTEDPAARNRARDADQAASDGSAEGGPTEDGAPRPDAAAEIDETLAQADAAPEASSEELLAEARRLRNLANMNRTHISDLRHELDSLDAELERRYEPRTNEAADRHHEATSERPDPTKKPEAKRGSGVTQDLLTGFVRGGSSGWLGVLEHASTGTWGWLTRGDEEQEELSELDAAEAALRKEPEEKSGAATAWDVATNTGDNIKGWVNNSLTPPIVKELVEAPEPPASPEALEETWEEARDHMEDNARYHAQAYNCYLLEIAVAAKSIEADELASTVGEMALERAEAQAEPIREGQETEREREARLNAADPESQPADGAVGGWMMEIIMMAISRGGDEVDGAPDNAEESDPSAAQDEAHETAADTQDDAGTASEEQQQYLDTLAQAQQDISGSIAGDKEAVEGKARSDYDTMVEIRSMKEDNIAKAAQHWSAGESRASQFNADLDTLAVWAADYKSRRDDAGVKLDPG